MMGTKQKGIWIEPVVQIIETMPSPTSPHVNKFSKN